MEKENIGKRPGCLHDLASRINRLHSWEREATEKMIEIIRSGNATVSITNFDSYGTVTLVVHMMNSMAEIVLEMEGLELVANRMLVLVNEMKAKMEVDYE